MIQIQADVSQKHLATSVPDVHTGKFRKSIKYQTKSNSNLMKTSNICVYI